MQSACGVLSFLLCIQAELDVEDGSVVLEPKLMNGDGLLNLSVDGGGVVETQLASTSGALEVVLLLFE